MDCDHAHIGRCIFLHTPEYLDDILPFRGYRPFLCLCNSPDITGVFLDFKFFTPKYFCGRVYYGNLVLYFHRFREKSDFGNFQQTNIGAIFYHKFCCNVFGFINRKMVITENT